MSTVKMQCQQLLLSSQWPYLAVWLASHSALCQCSLCCEKSNGTALRLPCNFFDCTWQAIIFPEDSVNY
jgi:hypothetical protein